MYIIINPLYMNSPYVWLDRRDYRKLYSQKFSLTIKLFFLFAHVRALKEK